MGWIRGRAKQLRALLRKERVERELDAEVRFHIEMETQQNVRSGMSAAEARRRALLCFGGTEKFKEEVRQARWTRVVEDAVADVRFAVRSLAKRPGFAAASVLTLALGIGGTTAVFSVVEGVLLKPLPYADPERLVEIDAGMGVMGEVLAMRGRVAALQRVEAYQATGEVSLTGEADPERLAAARVTPGLFTVLGASARIGRTFLPEEDRPGSDAVVLLGDGLWRRRFGSDPSLVGRRIDVDGVSRTVVGVMPAGFRFPSPAIQLWIPVVTEGVPPPVLWGSGGYHKIGRLRPGAAPGEARREVRALEPRMRELLPWTMPAEYWSDPLVVPLRDEMVGEIRPMLLLLFGAVALLLLVACANVANLLLARATARRGEVSIRAALGARRARIVRQLLTESLVLGLAGGGAGLGLAFGAVALLHCAALMDFPRIGEVTMDARVLGFAFAASLATSVLFGLVPALRASGSRAGATLAEGARAGTSRERQRLSAALVIAQIAVSAVLVIGATLLLRSFGRLIAVDPGFRPESVVVAKVAPPRFRYPEDEDRARFYRDVLERLASLPGPHAQAIGTGVPFGGDAFGSVFLIEGRPEPASSGDWPLADARLTVSAGYFRALGVPVLSGRRFTSADREGAPGVAIVSRGLAHRYWPGEDVVGKRLRLVFDEEWRTVVGVVGDVKWSDLGASAGSALYVPLGQGPNGSMRVVLRTGGDASAASAAVRSAVALVDGDAPVSDIRTERQLLSASLARPRSLTGLLALFAALALGLGAVGTYGVTAYAVGLRTREYGIRFALGAPRRHVLWLVLRRAGMLAIGGITVGVVAAFLASRVLSGALYGVSPVDPITFTVAPLVLVAVVLVASYVPARHATRVEPIRVLRSE